MLLHVSPQVISGQVGRHALEPPRTGTGAFFVAVVAAEQRATYLFREGCRGVAVGSLKTEAFGNPHVYGLAPTQHLAR